MYSTDASFPMHAVDSWLWADAAEHNTLCDYVALWVE